MTAEIFGHLLAFWTVTGEATTFHRLRVRAQDLLDVALAMYALIRLDRGAKRAGLPQRARMQSWVEALGVGARANKLGTIHARYSEGSVRVDCQEADDFTIALRAAWRFRRVPTARLAFKDYALSLPERGDDAFLYAFRAVEGIRRTFAPDLAKPNGRFDPVWGPMHTALGTSETMLAPLTDAAIPVRHGNADAPGLKRARSRRDAMLALAESVLRKYAHRTGVQW